MTTTLGRQPDAATEPTRPPSHLPPPDPGPSRRTRTATGLRAVCADVLRALEEHWSTMMLWRL